MYKVLSDGYINGSRHQSVTRSQSSPPPSTTHTTTGTGGGTHSTVSDPGDTASAGNGHSRFRRIHSEQRVPREDAIPEEGEVFFNRTAQISI